MKSTLKALVPSLIIMIGVILVITIVLSVFGQFRLDNVSYPDKFGIYWSALKGLPSYLNPLRQTLIVFEGIAILFLPACLFIFRKSLKLPILPWLITIGVSVVGLLAARPLVLHAYPFDDTVDSNSSWFLYVQAIVVVSIFIGQYAYYVSRKKRKQSKHAHSHQ